MSSLRVAGWVTVVASALCAAPAGAEDPAPAPAPAPPTAPAPEAAPAPLKPAQAWAEALKENGDPAKRKPNLLELRSREFLTAWDAAHQPLAPEDGYALGMMLQQVKRTSEALAALRTAAGCETLARGERARAGLAFAAVAAQASQQGRLEGTSPKALLGEVRAWEGLVEGPARAGYLQQRGALAAAAGEMEGALADWVAAADANHAMALAMAARVVDLLLEGVKDVDGAVAARGRAAPLLGRLKAFQTQAVEDARKARDEEKDEAMKPRREQALRGAEGALKRFEEVDRPLQIYGALAPAWTLVQAYGKGQALADYAGKVVVIDFWATWCPWCIKSFPALRDLLKAYEGKDLAVVGVTTSAANVYDQRYDLDDDLKARATGEPVKPVLSRPRLALTPGTEATAEQKAVHEKALAEFRAKEIEIIATFLKNHEVTWDVVQIDEQEPGPKYALSGWPHCVVIDRQGRVRYLHSGALLREQPDRIAAFRKILDGLLAEPGPQPAPK